ncbi:DUF2335 domain-containing protein [Thiovibrio sp. JS02]
MSAKKKLKNNLATQNHSQSPAVSKKQITTEHQILQEAFSGPIPSPRVLTEYEALSPGLADRIVQMAEKEMSHRHTQEALAISAGIDFDKERILEARIGQFLAFGVVICVLGVCGYLATHGAQTTASILGGGTIGSLAIAFIKGKAHSDPPKDD